MITPNAFFNNTPYWLYCDFPVAYDPCTCQNKGQLRIEAHLLNSADINFNLNSVPQTTPTVESGNVHADFLTTFSQISNQAEGGLKAARSTGEAFGSLDDAINKQTNVSLKQVLGLDKGKLKQTVDQAGNWLGLLPIAGNAINSVISLFDFFVDGGNQSKGPSPVYIVNNFKAVGQITSSTPKLEVTLPLPGSDPSGRDASTLPVYNNVLGIFNLLETPKVNVFRYTPSYDQIVQLDYCDPQQYEVMFAKRSGKWPWEIRLSGNIKYVVNPALNIDLSKSDIRASIIVEDCHTGWQTNLNTEVEKNGIPTYRSAYHPINFLNQTSCLIDIYGVYKNMYYNCHVDPAAITYSGSWCNPKIFLKVIARLKKPTGNSDDIIYIAKYPVSSTFFDNVAGWPPSSSGYQDLPEDATLQYGEVYTEKIYQSRQPITANISALNTITVKNNLPASATLTAGQSITLTAGYSLTTSSVLKAGGVYNTSAPSIESLQANIIEISNFCGGSSYNGFARYNPIARIASIDDIEATMPEKFFTAFPNPSSGKVSFRYYIEEPTQVQLNLISTTGSVVATPVNEYQEAGPYEISYDASNLPSGIYIYTLETSKGKETKRLVVIK